MKGKLLFPLLILGGFLFLIIMGTLQMSTKAMVFPWTVGGIGLSLIIWELIKNIKATEEKIPPPNQEAVSKKTYIINIIMMLAILPAIYILGFFIAIPLHVFSFMKMNGEKTRLSLSIAIGIALFIYFVLYIFMEIPFYEGWIFLHFSD